jgi:hypothetical protein
MFVVSQYILNLSGMCTTSQQITTYSIALGLILYGSVYLYILFYNNEYLNIFNKFIIYIVGVDLLLSAFYYYNLQSSDKLVKENEESESESEDEDDPEYESEDEDEDEQDDKEEDDNETQQYIQNLIKQANLSKQPLVPIIPLNNNVELEESIPLLVQQQQIPVFNQEEQYEQVEPEHLELEPEQSEQPEQPEQPEQTEATVDNDIDNIIEEVASKKKGGRKPRKTQATVV